MEGIYQLTWIDHLLAGIITFIIPAVALLRTQPALKDLQMDQRMRLAIYYSNSATLVFVALVVAGIWVAQGRTLHDLGFREPVPDSRWVFLSLLFLGLYFLDLLVSLSIAKFREKRKAQWQELTGFLPTNDKELFHFSLSVAPSAAFSEEVIYRGFLILYCLNFFPANSLGELTAVILPAFIFAAVHRYQGLWAVAKIFALAILFGLIFLLSKSLLAAMLIHFIIDLLGGLLGRYFFGKSANSSGE